MPAKRRSVKRTNRQISVSRASRFGEWLDDVMGRHSIANSSLSRHLGGEKVASSPRIRAWREGRLKKPRPDTCFRIGEALRSAGIQWSNGPLALIVGGYLAEFIGLLISLSKASIQGDFVAMVLFVVCATVAMPPGAVPDLADVQDEGHERLAGLFAHYSGDVLAAWERLPRSTQSHRRFVEGVDSSLDVALFLAEHLPVNDELRETRVFDALLTWIRPNELLSPGFGTFAKEFLDALRSSSSQRVVNHHYENPWRSPDDYFETWQRMWPHLMNEKEYDDQ
jgi:hypothetical protein